VVCLNQKQPYFINDPRLTPWQNFCSEALSATILKNVFYPLDVAQTLMQTNSADARDGIIPTLSHLHKTYGISSLFRGNIAANVSGTVLALGGFATKSLMVNATFDSRLATFATSILPAQLFVAVLYPFQVAKVRLITEPAKYQDTIQTLETIYEEEGVYGLYKGFGFTIFETLPFMATTYAGYELAGFLFRKSRVDLSVTENVALAMLGAFFASLLHYPFDTAKKIVMSRKNVTNGDSVLKTLADVGEKHGILGLWKGFSAHVLKFPSLLIQRSIFHFLQTYFLRSNRISPPYRHPNLRVLGLRELI